MEKRGDRVREFVGSTTQQLYKSGMPLAQAEKVAQQYAKAGETKFEGGKVPENFAPLKNRR